MAKYNPITLKLCRGWLYKYIDRINYGIWDSEKNEPRFAYREETVIMHDRLFHKINMTDIEQHLLSNRVEDTKYYTAWAGADTALLCIDIDAHEGQSNAWNVAEWIKGNFLPESYYEPSTHGLGIHLYFLVEVKKNGYPMKRGVFNEYIEDFGRKLQYVVVDEFPSDSARVCGIHGTITWKDREGNLHRDHMAKIPRPRTVEDALRLRNMPVYSLGDLKRVVDEAERRQAENRPQILVEWNQVGKKSCQKKKTISSVVKANDANLRDRLWDENPNKRVFNAVCELQRILQKRNLSVEEVHDFYCQVGLNTDEDVKGRRGKRILAAIEKCGKDFSFDYLKKGRGYDIGQFHAERYLDSLKSRLINQDLRSTKYRRKICYEDIALYLDVIADGIIHDNLGNPQRFCSVSNEFVKSAFEEASVCRILKSKADNSKVVALRSLAVKAGMIEVVDSSWVHSGSKYSEGGEFITSAKGESQNRGMKYEITCNHPRYEEFMKAKEKHEELMNQTEQE
jgi:hypothetical protein